MGQARRGPARQGATVELPRRVMDCMITADVVMDCMITAERLVIMQLVIPLRHPRAALPSRHRLTNSHLDSNPAVIKQCITSKGTGSGSRTTPSKLGAAQEPVTHCMITADLVRDCMITADLVMDCMITADLVRDCMITAGG